MRKKILICMLAAVSLMVAGCSAKTDKKKDTTEQIVLDTDNYATYVKKLGKYTGLSYTTENTDATETQIDDMISQMLDYNYSEKVEITDRAIKDGDTVNIDYIGYVDGKQLDSASSTDSDGNLTGKDLVIGSGNFVDDFEEQLIGAKKGDNLTVEVTFPKDYALSKDMQGKDATFEVTINGIYKTEVPEEMTDEMVKADTEYDSVEALRAAIAKDITDDNKTQARKDYINDLIEQIIDDTTFDGYDQDTYDKFYNDCKTADETYADQFDYDDLEAYVKDMYKFKDLDEYEADLKEKCIGYTKKMMVIYEIAKEENIDISEQALKNYETELCTKYAYDSVDAMLEQKNEQDIKYDMLAEKVYSFLLKNSTAVDPE